MPFGLRHPVVRAVVFSHVWLAAGAMAQVWWSGSFVGAADRRAMLAVGAVLIAAYGFMRVVRSWEPQPIPSPWIRWVADHRAAVILLSCFSALVALWAAWRMQRTYAPWDLLVIALVALYLIPLLDPNGRSRGLRQVPMLKAPLIALVWAMATTAFAPRSLSAEDHDLMGTLFFLQFTFFFGMTMVFDSMDLPNDPPALRTIPQVIGEQRTRILAAFMMVPWIVFLAVLQAKDGLQWHFLLPLLGYGFAALVLLRSSAQRGLGYSAVLMDGLLLLIPVLAWCGTLCDG